MCQKKIFFCFFTPGFFVFVCPFAAVYLTTQRSPLPLLFTPHLIVSGLFTLITATKIFVLCRLTLHHFSKNRPIIETTTFIQPQAPYIGQQEHKSSFKTIVNNPTNQPNNKKTTEYYKPSDGT